MELIKENWLLIGVSIFLLLFVLYGHYRGLLQMAVTMIALIASLLLVHIAMPHVTGYLKENTKIHQVIGESLLNVAGIETGQRNEQVEMPAQQRVIIENMKLPEQMKEALLQNNNNEIYSMLGVDVFFDYVGTYLANMVLNILGSMILFVLCFVIIRILLKALDIVAHLPVLYGINKIAGAILGGIQGLMIVWGAALIVNACSTSFWAVQVLAQVEQSLFLSLLYYNNLFDWLLSRALNGFV